MSKNEPLSEKEMMDIAPSIFTTESCTKVSEKYSFIPTIRVVEDLKNSGWLPYDVSQAKSKYGGGLYGKHMLRFRNEDIGMIDDTLPEIILTNSHDGRNSFRLHAGLFRLVCANGLIIADATFDKIKIKHQWYTMKDVTKATEAMTKKIPELTSNINRFKTTILDEKSKKRFARLALKTRWSNGNDSINMENLLRPMRIADEGNQLWKVYNVVQEKLIGGGMIYNLPNGRQQTTRELTNIDKRIDVNKKLWSLTEEYGN
tara:strand:+ start:8508 stop:9284 length:777 start_codon:yes stop_codon:yes gene_type:complete